MYFHIYYKIYIKFDMIYQHIWILLPSKRQRPKNLFRKDSNAMGVNENTIVATVKPYGILNLKNILGMCVLHDT